MTTDIQEADPIGADLDEGSGVAQAAIDLLGLSRDELRQVLIAVGVPDRQAKMRAAQLWRWIYHYGQRSFEAMTNIGKELRRDLDGRFRISRPEVTNLQVSSDGTRKYLLRFADGKEAEMVYIPDQDRGTLCVSSQVGCTLNCRFCLTGTQKLVRNLEAGEIVAQILVARDDLDEWVPSSTAGRRVTNIVMMGMGEPLYNFENVKKALHIIMDEEGIQMSRRRITLSTAGVVPMMQRAGEEIGVNLAVSLHATNDEVRSQIVPLNRKYPLKELLKACQDYPGTHNARRITLEYVMLKGLNDSDQDARELIHLIKAYDLPAKVNLIPFNPWDGAVYECSDPDRIKRFSSLIFDAGISAPVRTPRGRDIMAACGQLKSVSQKTPKSARQKASSAV